MDERQWHLSKSVSLGHIITTASVATAVILWFAAMDNRVSGVEKDQVYLQATVNRVEQQQKEQGQDFSNQVADLKKEMNDNFLHTHRKLDKIIERELNR